MPKQRLTLLASATLILALQGTAIADLSIAPSDSVAPYLKMDNKKVLDQKSSLKIIRETDWKKAQRVEIIVEDNMYEPDELTLKTHQPYIITMKNVGGAPHDVAGEGFFSSVVVREVRTAGVKMAAFHLESLHLKPNSELEIWLVPIRGGEFPFVCTLPGHFEDGMEGGFIIEE